MRHILLTFGISLLLGAMALPTQAQVVNGHVTFLGIPLNETPQGMRDKLMAKGMKKAVGMETDTGNIGNFAFASCGRAFPCTPNHEPVF